jgi:hypothetical protein
MCYSGAVVEAAEHARQSQALEQSAQAGSTTDESNSEKVG